MFLHIFLFHWQPGTSPEQQHRAEAEIRAFAGVIPGLLWTTVGTNLSPHGGSYTFGGAMQFADRASYERYTTHPAHMALLGWLRPLIEAVELDLPAAEL